MSDQYVASIVTSMPGTGQTRVFIPPEWPYTDDDIDQLSLAMRTQGTWFMGRECRTEEQSRKVARDLLIMCDVMRYYKLFPLDDGPLHPGWVPPVPQATDAVPGTPGYFLPEGCEIPYSIQDTHYQYYNQVTPWAAGQYLLLGDGSKATFVGANVASHIWTRPWVKNAAEELMQFPEEPTLTANDAANAAKLAGLGYVPKVTTNWGNPMMIGPFYFIWRNSAWAV